jgi:hypothetical protein
MIPAFGWAHNASIDISTPEDEQEFIVDTLPMTLTVKGMITHSAPPAGANVADSKACVTVDEGTPAAVTVCEPALVFQGKPPTYYEYSVNVTLHSEGAHTLRAYTSKTDGGHPGQSELMTIYVYLASITCDEVDPPAYANQYMNAMNLPQEYAKLRGKVVQVIAQNHAAGVYGSCTYEYDAVVEDVCAELAKLGGPACPQ